LPSHIDHGLSTDGPAHGPFVHQSWFWRKRGSIHEKPKIRADSERFPDAPAFAEYEQRAPTNCSRKSPGSPVTTTIDFVLPNIRTEEDRSGKLWFFPSRRDVTPVRRDCLAGSTSCGVEFVFPAVRFSDVRQGFSPPGSADDDQQAEGLKHNPRLMLIDDADRPANGISR